MKTQTITRPNAMLVASLCAMAFLLSARRVEAQANANPPNLMTYQGYLVDANGTALGTNAPKNYDVIFRIWDGASGGNKLWTEQQTVTVDKGYFSVLLGEGSSIGEARPALNTLFTNATASDRWIGLTVKGIGGGGSDVDILPRLRLLTSPYSFLAQKANTVDGAGLTSGTVADARLSANVALRAGGNNFTGNQVFGSGDLFMDNQRILAARNSVGTYENVFWPRWSDNITYLNFGTGGFNIRNNASASVMFMQNGGNVGIGTTSPADSLQIGDFSNGDRYLSIKSAGGNAYRTGIKFRHFNDTGGFNIEDYEGNPNGLNFIRYPFGTAVSAMFMDRFSGNVGIGTTSPGARLHIADSSFPAARIESSSTVGTWLALGNTSVGGRYWQMISSGSANGGGAGKLLITSGTGAGSTDANPMTLQSDGNVGINTLAPQTALHVVGGNGTQLRLHSSANGTYWNIWSESTPNSGNLLLTPNAGTGSYINRNNGSFNSLSDVRLKTDISPLDSLLDRVLKLRPVSYRFKSAPDDSARSLGFIAQEVESLFPEIVSEAAGYKGLAYDEFAPVTVGAIQEMNQKLESKLREKERELTSVQARLAEIEAQQRAGDARLAELEKLLRAQLSAGRTTVPVEPFSTPQN